MPKPLIYILFLLLANTSYSQEKISKYKLVADKAITSYFDSSLLSRIKCTDFSITTLDNRRVWYKYYEPNKNIRIYFSTATFSYSFYSKTIDYEFTFDVTVDKDKIVKSDSTLSEIPKCISNNTECNFVKKDSAIKLALADSIEYPNNLTINFNHYYNRNHYYWLITGYPKEIPSKRVIKTRTRAISSRQRKIIDALTGKIILWEEFINHN